jgi:hypothetical protein
MAAEANANNMKLVSVPGFPAMNVIETNCKCPDRCEGKIASDAMFGRKITPSELITLCLALSNRQRHSVARSAFSELSTTIKSFGVKSDVKESLCTLAAIAVLEETITPAQIVRLCLGIVSGEIFFGMSYMPDASSKKGPKRLEAPVAKNEAAEAAAAVSSAAAAAEQSASSSVPPLFDGEDSDADDL